jgi:hypothetical protein
MPKPNEDSAESDDEMLYSGQQLDMIVEQYRQENKQKIPTLTLPLSVASGNLLSQQSSMMPTQAMTKLPIDGIKSLMPTQPVMTSPPDGGKTIEVKQAKKRVIEIISLDESNDDNTPSGSLFDDSNHNVVSSGEVGDEYVMAAAAATTRNRSTSTLLTSSVASSGEGGDVPLGNLKDDNAYNHSATAAATTKSQSTSTLLTSSNLHLQNVQYSSNLLDEGDEEEDEEEYQAREQLTEDEIDRLANEAQGNRTSFTRWGLFSSTFPPGNRNDGDLVFDQVQYLLLAIEKWNELSERERSLFGIRNPAQPFYIFSGNDAKATYNDLTTDEIAQLDITELLGNLDLLAKAMQVCRGDNGLNKLCGGRCSQYSNIDGARFVRGDEFLVVKVKYTAEDESRFVTSQVVEGGPEKMEELRLRAKFNCAKVAHMQIIVRMNDEIIHKYASKDEVLLDLMLTGKSLSSVAMRSEEGLTIDIGATHSNYTHRAGLGQPPLYVNFKATTTSFAEFAALPMAYDCDGEHKRMRNRRITALCRREIQIKQPGETGESYVFDHVTAAVTWARSNDAKDKYVKYQMPSGKIITEQDIKDAGPSGLVTERQNNVPRGKGKWTWTFTGVLTHTNSQTKVVRKFKKEHDGNYYEVIDDIVDGGEP